MKESIVSIGSIFCYNININTYMRSEKWNLPVSRRENYITSDHLPVADIFYCSNLLVKQVWKCFVCLLL